MSRPGAAHQEQNHDAHMVEGLIYFLVGIDGDVHGDTGFSCRCRDGVAHGIGAGAVGGRKHI